MSEVTDFDKEMEKLWEDQGLENWTNKAEATKHIKHLIEKHVIGSNVPPDFTNPDSANADTLFYENTLKDKQRQSLWGNKK